MTTYDFPGHHAFLNRERELALLREWYEDPGADPVLVLYGRRRSGKSWLFREFAHGLEADILVCDRRVVRDQLAGFATQLTSKLEVRPQLNTATDLFQVIFGLGRRRRCLVVLDEFPELFGSRGTPDSELAAVLEEQLGRTQAKLILCGSQIATMTRLLRARSPLHGRARQLLVKPLDFVQARTFLGSHNGADLIRRYALAGGMPRYLSLFGRTGSLKQIACSALLDPRGALFDEPRTVLEMELPEPAVHFSLLTALAAHKELAYGDLLSESKVDDKVASRYLQALEQLFLVEAANPIFSTATARRRRYRVADHLTRFWFRFVFPFQQDLDAGLEPGAHWDRSVAPHLDEHVAATFEQICRAWTLRTYATTTDRVGAWWGLSRHDLRRRGQRTSEEIDIVGGRDRLVTVIGEVKWTNRPMRKRTLDDLRELKVPALAQSGVEVSGAEVVLFSRSGFDEDLLAEATAGRIRLVGLDELLFGLR